MFRSALAALLLLPLAAPAAGPQPKAKIPVVIDTDIGDDLDDALALALALSSPELDVRGITTVAGDAHTRALIVCRLLHAVGRKEIPVASGAAARAVPDFNGQMQYGLRPAFRNRPTEELAVEFLYKQLKAAPGELTIIALGPLTNVAALLAKYPDCKPWIKRLVVMGGAVKVGYNGKPPAEPEWNIKSDVEAAKAVFASGVPLTVVPLDATAHLSVPEKQRRWILARGTPLTNQLLALYQLWDKTTPVLFDPAAVAVCFDERFFTLEPLRLEVDAKGMTRTAAGKANARVAVASRGDEFVSWYADRVGPKELTPLPKLPRTNLAKTVERGAFPNLVHVVEDYETDIERRWWLSGLLETKDVPPGSKRACRAVLTDDFDDRQGDPKALYKGVIFNPVPGPPMGKNPRLSFRYKVTGTDALRVQIYTLSKGYHRHLTLTGLPQGKWQSAAVDMTAARRPDGSGGPLSEDERIDDVQFYTDPGAELLIDDIVLYDAAGDFERSPFPEKLLFTGWFDTGKQGKEWPGTFEIVAKAKPHTWKAAKSVADPKTGEAVLRVGLRGDRPLPKVAHVRFRYLLDKGSVVTVALVNLKQQTWTEVRCEVKEVGRWAEGSAVFRAAIGELPSPDAIHFRMDHRGAELLIDDVLLYEP